MVVETFNDGTMVMNFNGADGTKLDVTAKNHFITLKFIDKDGNPFEFTSDGYEFTVPGLKFDVTGYKIVATDTVPHGSGHSSDHSTVHRRRMAASSQGDTAVSDDHVDNP